ncbi:MAG: redoxin domain-containing protein [Actinomycetota bacterium]|nr:redoxin domain-containing protein [Actinomycetota bacterium]
MGNLRAPELVGSGGWINTEPLSLDALRGKVVVLFFWAAGNALCHGDLEELRELSDRYPDELVVVGVHSPKFPGEGDHRRLTAELVRLGITGPVLDDPDMVTWQQYGVQGWPYYVVVDPRGRVEGAIAGEDQLGLLTQVVRDLITEQGHLGTLDRTPLPTTPADPPPGSLAFPQRVALDRHGRMAVADTAHDRVLVASLDVDPDPAGSDPVARITHVVRGLRRPRGARLVGDTLLICDTGRNRIGRIDLSERPDADELADIDDAGIAHLRLRHADVIAYDIPQPWDLLCDFDGSVVVASAAGHQLWRIPTIGDPGVVCGTGVAGLADGKAVNADLGQPSGLTRFPGAVVFVDAETSALRRLTNEGRVVTLAGAGLFDWGRRDGRRSRALLQHPEGVVASPRGDVAYIADTYNDAIRFWRGKRVGTLEIEGLARPGGLDVLSDGRLVVADTFHHRIVVVDPYELSVREVHFERITLPPSAPVPSSGEELRGRNGEPLTLEFDVELGELWPDAGSRAPVRVSVSAEPGWLLDAGPREWEHDRADGRVVLTAGSVGRGVLTVRVSADACGDGVRTIRRSERIHALVVT